MWRVGAVGCNDASYRPIMFLVEHQSWKNRTSNSNTHQREFVHTLKDITYFTYISSYFVLHSVHDSIISIGHSDSHKHRPSPRMDKHIAYPICGIAKSGRN